MAVTLTSRWNELLTLRAWLKWQRLAKRAAPQQLEFWTQAEGCYHVEDGQMLKCKHLDEKKCWCRLQKLPATVNPILTVRHGIIGMACMGAGFEAEEKPHVGVG